MDLPERVRHSEPWDPPPPTVRGQVSELLKSLLGRVADGRSHCLWIDGEAGVGKTALLDLLAQRAVDEGCIALSARCPLPDEGELDWSRILAGARPPLPPDLVDRPRDADPQRPSRVASSELPIVDHAHRAWKAISETLAAISRRGPVVMHLDDGHRASEEVASQIVFLFRTLADAPVLWVISGEPCVGGGGLVPLRKTMEGLRRLTPFALGPLGEDEIGRLLAERFEPDERERLVPWLLGKTGGNPLFIREVIRGLIESGRIERTEGGGYRLLGDLGGARIPATLEEIMRERLASLDADSLAVLRGLAALGGESDPTLIRQLLSGKRRSIEEPLRRLRTTGLIRAVRGPGALHTISPSWLGAVALRSFPDPPAEDLCLRAAGALEKCADLPVPIRLSRRARSLEQSGVDCLAVASAHQEAAEAAWKSNSQGAARAHIESAIRFLDEEIPAVGPAERERRARRLEERVLSLAGTIHATIGPFHCGLEELERLRGRLEIRRPAAKPERWAELELLMGHAHRNLGRYDDALADYARGLDRLRGGTGARVRAQILLETAWVHYERGAHEEGLRAARRATQAMRRARTLLDVCRARNLEGLITWAQSRHAEAERILKDTLRRMAPLGTIPLEAAVWNNLSLVHWSLGNLDEATRCLARSRRIRVATGQLWGEAVCIANQALIEEDRGHFESSARLHREALRIRESLDDRRGMVIGRGNLANILRQTGECEDGFELIECAIGECRSMGVQNLEPGLLCTRSGLHRLLGRPVEALQDARHAVKQARRFQNARLVAYGLENQARAETDLGRFSTARKTMRLSRSTIRSGSPIDLGTILLSEAEMVAGWSRAGRGACETATAEAQRLASEAVEIFQRHGAAARIARASLFLSELGLAATAAEPTAAPHPDAARSRGTAARIHCFGPLRIATPDGRMMGPGDWGSHKARAIFSYLLFHRSLDPGVPRERILETIWPEAPLDTVEKTFHATLNLLRRALSAGIDEADAWARVVHSGGCYRLAFREEPWIDCVAFEEALREGARWERQGIHFRAMAAYRQAEALYQSDFLEDSYHGWTDPVRERYRQDRLDLLHRLGTLSLAAWDAAACLGWVQRLLALDPLDERACRLGMRAHAASGRRKAGVDLYHAFARRLRTEIGAEPETRTTEIYRDLKSGKGSLGSGSPQAPARSPFQPSA